MGERKGRRELSGTSASQGACVDIGDIGRYNMVQPYPFDRGVGGLSFPDLENNLPPRPVVVPLPRLFFEQQHPLPHCCSPSSSSNNNAPPPSPLLFPTPPLCIPLFFEQQPSAPLLFPTPPFLPARHATPPCCWFTVALL